MLTKPVYNLSSYSLRGDGLGLRPFLFLISNAITLAWLPSDKGSCTVNSNIGNTIAVDSNVSNNITDELHLAAYSEQQTPFQLATALCNLR